MGAGSTKGVQDIDSSDGENISIASKDEFPSSKNAPSKITSENNNVKSNIRRKIEMVSDESDIDNDAPNTPKSTSSESKQQEDTKRGLFGFSRKKEVTNAIVHESKDEKTNKKNASKSFRIFNFKKDSNVDNKDETLDKDITELQTTFDSLGIEGKSIIKSESTAESHKNSTKRNPTSQSADDIRNLEPMRNRLNARRRFSRPANAVIPNSGPFGAPRRSLDAKPNSGLKRNFRYSWEKENTPVPPSSQNEEWDYESVAVKNFDIDKFISANSQVPFLNQPESSKHRTTSISENQLAPENDSKSTLNYDSSEQRLLAMIERDFV